MKKILFLIHDLGQGGAEKVLVNLVNNMDRTKFDVSVVALFGGGINEQFLAPHIHFRAVFSREIPGNSRFMKLLSPEKLHKICVKERYDIEISYLEGPSARVISGCRNADTKLVSWIHVEQHNMKNLAKAFRNEREAIECYNRFDQTICVSQFVKTDFTKILNFKKNSLVLHNTVESDRIIEKSQQMVTEITKGKGINLIAVGTLKKSKGYERLLCIVRRLKEEAYDVKLYILGRGPLEKQMREYIIEHNLTDTIILLGYQTNPYRFIAKCDLFVCASFAEGFSTATTESLILGVPVCTVEVSGMKEILGENNEYGIVTHNNEEALYNGIKNLLDNPEQLDKYRTIAIERGKMFQTQETVDAVENMLLSL